MQTWTEAQARLVEVAAGRAPADLVIRGGVWVNVHTGELLPGLATAVHHGILERHIVLDHRQALTFMHHVADMDQLRSQPDQRERQARAHDRTARRTHQPMIRTPAAGAKGQSLASAAS